jgi:hypothetical protein
VSVASTIEVVKFCSVNGYGSLERLSVHCLAFSKVKEVKVKVKAIPVTDLGVL